eukprot:TRINITY_DN22829_c0_g1_i1.p1 TRINITY_DN22829_c0_g1~~TRINITY_DN22829_c0_g1_i1.p1  ORF type:complete len:450 (+),score=72.09 TRINITY_DN22829_c0_g1_i1:23-1351(+)
MAKKGSTKGSTKKHAIAERYDDDSPALTHWDASGSTFRVNQSFAHLTDDAVDSWWVSWLAADIGSCSNGKYVCQTLDLSNNKLTGVGLARALKAFIYLGIPVLVLKLHKNSIDDAGMDAIAELVSASSSAVQEIHLSHNQVTSEGTCRLLAAVQKSGRYPCKLKKDVAPLWLRLEHNRIDLDRVFEFASSKGIRNASGENRDCWNDRTTGGDGHCPLVAFHWSIIHQKEPAEKESPRPGSVETLSSTPDSDPEADARPVSRVPGPRTKLRNSNSNSNSQKGQSTCFPGACNHHEEQAQQAYSSGEAVNAAYEFTDTQRDSHDGLGSRDMLRDIVEHMQIHSASIVRRLDMMMEMQQRMAGTLKQMCDEQSRLQINQQRLESAIRTLQDQVSYNSQNQVATGHAVNREMHPISPGLGASGAPQQHMSVHGACPVPQLHMCMNR